MRKVEWNCDLNFLFVHELVVDPVLLPVGVDPQVVAVDGGVEVGALQLLSCTFLGFSVWKYLGGCSNFHYAQAKIWNNSAMPGSLWL